MSSLRRIAASRANGKKSQGPVTPEGKIRSAASATRHGLASPDRAAHGICLRNENPAEFKLLYESLVAEHAPATATEHLLVHEMTAARWRLNRALAIESALLDNQMDLMMDDVAKTYEYSDETTRTALAFRRLAEISPSLQILHRYETRLSRQFERCLKRLAELRAAAPPEEIEELPVEPNPKNGHLPDDDHQLPDHAPVHAAQSAASPEHCGPAVISLKTAPQLDGVRLQTRPEDREPLSGDPSDLPRAA